MHTQLQEESKKLQVREKRALEARNNYIEERNAKIAKQVNCHLASVCLLVRSKFEIKGCLIIGSKSVCISYADRKRESCSFKAGRIQANFKNSSQVQA